MLCFPIIAVSLLLSTVVSTEGSVFTPQQEADVIDFVNQVMACRHIPGLTLSVVDGSQTWTKGFGIADIESGRPVDEDTLFGIGSLGKAFTVTLLGSLLDKTSYQWHTKLDDIEEVNFEFVTEELTKNTTLADLLAHRTGLSAATDYGFIAGYPPQATRDFLSRRLKHVPSVSNFRQSFYYNNLMYMVLGDVIDKLGKETYENLLPPRVFEPIGMMSTKVSTSSNDVTIGNVAKPIISKEKDGEYEEGDYAIYKLTPLEPAGTIMSNAVDMAKWMRFNLNNGTTQDGQTLVNRDHFMEIFQDQTSIYFYSIAFDLRTPTFPINDLNTAYGFGWFVSTYRGHKRFWHSGGLFSYVSLQWLFPDVGVGVFGNVNGPGNNHKPVDALKVILFYIADILLKEEPWLTPVTGCTFPSPWRNATTFTPPNSETPSMPSLTDYVGLYGNRVLPDVNVTYVNGNLIVNMNRIKGKLHPTQTFDEFRLELTDPWEYAIEKVLNENYTSMSTVKFSRNDVNETEMFEWFIDSWITFEKGVYMIDEADEPSSNTTVSPSRSTTVDLASGTDDFKISRSLLTALLFMVYGIFK